MRVDRFLGLVVDVLRATAHPDIASVEPYDAPGHNNPCGVKVTMGNGSVVWLRITGTARDGGDDHRQPEHILHPEWVIPSNFRERLHEAKQSVGTPG